MTGPLDFSTFPPSVTPRPENHNSEHEVPRGTTPSISASSPSETRADASFEIPARPRRTMTKEERHQTDRIQTTASSESKSGELVRYGIDVHDWQVDADLRRSKEFSEDELQEMVERQQELAKLFRASVLKKQEARAKETPGTE